MVSHANNKLMHILFIILFILLVCAVLCIYIFIASKRYAKQMYPGIYIDTVAVTGKTPAQVLAIYQPQKQALQNFILNIQYQNKPIATISAQDLKLKLNDDLIITQAYAMGKNAHTISGMRQKIELLFGLKKYTFNTRIESDTTTLDEKLTDIELLYNIPPEDAKFEMTDGKVTTFRPHKNGIVLNTNVLRNKLQTMQRADFLVGTMYYPLTASVATPQITTEQSNTFGIRELVAVGTSDYTHSIPERIHNLTLASARLHGTIIQQGEILSYNETVGDISRATGYKPAYVIINGRTQLGDGGGVCQTSTTLFRTALAAGLPIVAWTPHAYRVGYYENDSEPGRDATVYAPTVDLKIKNDTPGPLLLQVRQNEDTLTLVYELWGQKDARLVETTEPVTWDPIPAPAPRYEEDPTLPRGVTKQVDWAAAGIKAKFHYKVTLPDGSISQDRDFVSVYRPWQAIFLVGTKD